MINSVPVVFAVERGGRNSSSTRRVTRTRRAFRTVLHSCVVIPEIAKVAKHLTVFQRTPQYTLPANNHPLDDRFVVIPPKPWNVECHIYWAATFHAASCRNQHGRPKEFSVIMERVAAGKMSPAAGKMSPAQGTAPR